jgi:beta-glucosidase
MNSQFSKLSLVTLLISLAFSAPLSFGMSKELWMDQSQSPEKRSHALLEAMTLDEKLVLIMGFDDGNRFDKVSDLVIPPALKASVKASAIPGSAGYVPGIPRLHIPPQWQTDASIGVRVIKQPHTALPSSLGTAASFDPAVTKKSGEMIAQEARASGFNVLLAGGANLSREPRNGRNFEYVGEDPWHASQMAGGLIQGIQSTHMISTMKHFALNDQESERKTLDVTIPVSAMRQSDLLAFEFILDHAQPASVMCSYNLIGGRWACENEWLLNKTLKRDWGFKGYVMSDWGAVHSTTDSAMNGLDQLAGYPCCDNPPPEKQVAYFNAQDFKEALSKGEISEHRLDDMVERILWAMFKTGIFDNPPQKATIDFKENKLIAQKAAEESLVLLKNDDHVLPLKAHSIVVIGSHADKGVLAGSGSTDVYPMGGNAVTGLKPTMMYLPSSPLLALKQELPKSEIQYTDGEDISKAVAMASKADAAIVFVNQFNGEGSDYGLELKGQQDALVTAITQANPKTIVVVESGGAVYMPWLPQVKAVLEAFYPGSGGGEAIARILSGKVNPSGHLPVSFPAANSQLAHSSVVGKGAPEGDSFDINYSEGAAIGYKWYDLNGMKPLFAFGYGLSYTNFNLSDLSVTWTDNHLKAHFQVKNTGTRSGKMVSQLYVSPEDFRKVQWEAPKRLGAFAKNALKPKQSVWVDLSVDPRLLATYETASNAWVIKQGVYHVLLGQSSDKTELRTTVTLPELRWSALHASRSSLVR